MIAIIAIASLAAFAWLAAVLTRGGPLAGALIVLLAGVCFGYPFFHLDAGPIPLTSDRVLFVVLLAQCFVWRRWGWTERRPIGKPEILLAAFVGVLVVSTLAHDWHYQHNVPASRLLFYYVMPAGMYWVARQTPLDDRGARLILGSLTIFGVYLALTALAEALRLHNLVFPAYIASNEYYEFFGRARGPLLNPAANGYLLAIGLGAALLWWPRLNRAGQLGLLAVAALFGAALYGTLTRCVWLGGIALLAVLGGLTLPKSWRLPVLGGVMLAGALVAVTQWEKLMTFKRDEGHGAQETAESVELRPILGLVAWKMFLQEPLFGCGFGHYRERYVDVLDDRDSDLPLDKSRRYVQHNVWLGLLTETGLVGTVLFTLLVGYWLRDAWRLWRSSAPLWARQFGLLFLTTFASYVCNAMFQDLAIVPMINMVLFFLAGLTAGLRPAGADSVTSSSLSRRERAGDTRPVGRDFDSLPAQC
ncbi:MAG TPA: O-antigen ligase family protein [Pirellulales bacterium]|jgi:O-antigen ligase|nr:O-antigen ligase family protein [Pirellulales bacterium]